VDADRRRARLYARHKRRAWSSTGAPLARLLVRPRHGRRRVRRHGFDLSLTSYPQGW